MCLPHRGRKKYDDAPGFLELGALRERTGEENIQKKADVLLAWESREQAGSCPQGWPGAGRCQRRLAQRLLTPASSKQVTKASCCLDSHRIFSLSCGRWRRRSLLPHRQPFSRKVSGNLTPQLLKRDSSEQHPGGRRKGD